MQWHDVSLPSQECSTGFAAAASKNLRDRTAACSPGASTLRSKPIYEIVNNNPLEARDLSPQHPLSSFTVLIERFYF
jgi:hypothetical protein